MIRRITRARWRPTVLTAAALAFMALALTGLALPGLARSAGVVSQQPNPPITDTAHWVTPNSRQSQPTADRQSTRNSTANRTDQRTNPTRNRGGVTAEREAAALTFVEQHHAELGRLLRYLKRHKPDDYTRAIRDLFRKSEQLAVIRERGDDDRYDLELNIWKADSRATLLAARIQTKESPELREQLQRTLARKLNYQEQLMRRERDRLVDRLDKMNAQLTALDSSREDRIERQMRMMIRRAENQSTRRANNGTEKTE